MEEAVVSTNEVVVQSRPNKQKPLNEMSAVSKRLMNVDETRKYAAGLNEPARIATAYAGVSTQGDANNLIIRGNAPNVLLWRFEGVDIPNSNHFAIVSTSGGYIECTTIPNSNFISITFFGL